MNTLTQITAITMLCLGSVCYAASTDFDCEKLKKGKIEEVLKQKAETPEDFYCKANALRLNEKYDAAISVLNSIDSAKLSKEQQEQLMLSLAAAYRGKEDFAKAKETYNLILGLGPSEPVKHHIEQILEEF